MTLTTRSNCPIGAAPLCKICNMHRDAGVHLRDDETGHAYQATADQQTALLDAVRVVCDNGWIHGDSVAVPAVDFERLLQAATDLGYNPYSDDKRAANQREATRETWAIGTDLPEAKQQTKDWLAGLPPGQSMLVDESGNPY